MELERPEDLVSFLASRCEEVRRVRPPDLETIFRVSGMARMCPREEVLCGLEGIWREDRIGGDLGFAFLVGRAVHRLVQNELLGDVILGRWRCVSCGHVHENREGYGSGRWIRRPVRCDEPRWSSGDDGKAISTSCGGESFEFVETLIVDADAGWSGHADGAVAFGIGNVVIEFKTMNARTFGTTVDGPLPEHRIQGSLYMGLSGYRQLAILAMCKTLGRPAATFRVWWVKRDDRTIAEQRRKVDSFREGLVHRKLPERICATAECPRAKACQVASRCFGVAL